MNASIPNDYLRRYLLAGVLVCALALVAAGSVTQPADAHRMSGKAAKASAKRYMKRIYRAFKTDGATGYSVGKCSRRSSHRFVCRVSLRFPKSRCSDKLAISYRSRRSHRVRYRLLGTRIKTCGL
jgi:hypothetical protein